MGFFNIFEKKEKKEVLNQGLEKTKSSFFNKLAHAIVGKTKIDEDTLDQLEEILLTSDVGIDTTLEIIKRIEERVSKDKYLSTSDLKRLLQEEVTQMIATKDGQPQETSSRSMPYVILVVGVNGVGKTTTIGKLAYKYKSQGKKVVLGAADTFRAAAIEQLSLWGNRIDVPVIKQQMGSDPASVAYDTLSAAIAQKADVVIIDTAGRLHNKVGLMNELTKIQKVIKKIAPSAPDETLLVLDGSTGQNAFEQAKKFMQATSISSLAITKLDGTAKGGVVLGIAHQLQIPIKYIGLGEAVEDLQEFNKNEFIQALFSEL